MDILEQITASNTSNSLPGNTAFCLRKHKFSSDILSSPAIYHVKTLFFFRDTKVIHCCTVTLLCHTANFTSSLALEHIVFLFLSWIGCCQGHVNLSFYIV